jgi:hypothetical protein
MHPPKCVGLSLDQVALDYHESETSDSQRELKHILDPIWLNKVHHLLVWSSSLQPPQMMTMNTTGVNTPKSPYWSSVIMVPSHSVSPLALPISSVSHSPPAVQEQPFSQCHLTMTSQMSLGLGVKLRVEHV